MHALELPGPQGPRLSVYQKLVPNHRLNAKPSNLYNEVPSRAQTPVPRSAADPSTRSQQVSGSSQPPPLSPSLTRRVSYAPTPAAVHQNSNQVGYTPIMESVDHAIKSSNISAMHLSDSMTSDDFTRAVAVATVSALRHQQTHAFSPNRARVSGVSGEAETEGGHGGHDAPSWTRTFSAGVLLGCTALYAIIAGKLPRTSAILPLFNHCPQKSSLMLLMLYWKALASTKSSWESHCSHWCRTPQSS